MSNKKTNPEKAGLPKRCPSCGGGGCGSPCGYGYNEYDAMVGEQEENCLRNKVDYEWEMYKRSMPERSEICDEAVEYAFKLAFNRAMDLYR